jgi:hypothetical protein
MESKVWIDSPFCFLKGVVFYADMIVIIPPSCCHSWHLHKKNIHCMFVLFNQK